MTAASQPPRIRLAALANAADADIDPTEVALLLATLQRPRRPIEPHLAHLAALAAEVAEAVADTGAEARARALAEVLGRRHDFGGDDSDPAGATLIDVLQERRGTPEALGLLWLAVARRAGWRAEALAFPAHLLVRIEDDTGGRAIVDPFAGGAMVDAPAMRAQLKAVCGAAAELEPDHHAPLGARPLLIRLENAAKLCLLRAGQVEAALAVVEGILLFAPDQAALWREAGMMHMRLDHMSEAVAALEQFVARTGNTQAKARTQALLAELKGRM
ncbi:MAG: transglutaminase family protein [Magnetospirillum sp.]|nr:transglutaminase family protein [Magnetospirillum sp.]